MSTLKEKLEDFERKIIEKRINETQNEDKLQELFMELAPTFLYGGYIKVREDYKVYIRTVEFYFHCEKENGIHDPIVYHRNNRYIEGSVPYFPLMSIHAHPSGFDITFENPEEQYRASALIREYEVWDNDKKCYLKYDVNIKKFRKRKDNEPVKNGQSTYLYDFLNGFGKDYVGWYDDDKSYQINEIIKPTHRKGVLESTSHINYEPKIIEGHKIQDKRQWSFTRQEDIVS